MSYKKINAALTGLLLLVATSANAGLITDTTNDSFIDETTGLEWMDFGVNNGHSYSQVDSLLQSTYSGWMLATESQVLTMWHNAFSGKGSVADIVHDTGSRYAYYVNNEASNKLFVDIYRSMGYGYESGFKSRGWFENDTGGMSYAEFTHINEGLQFTGLYGRTNNYQYFRTNGNSNHGTMLVRAATVPEPSTLTVFVLGMIGLVSRRFKKQ